MILVVGGTHLSAAAVADRLEVEELVLATSATEARERLAVTAPTAMVVGGPATDDAVAALLEDVRAGRVGEPWIAVAVVSPEDGPTQPAVDATVQPAADHEALAAAVERTVLLGRYRRAIHAFFDACCGRQGAGGRDRSLEEARREADARLEAIQDRVDGLPMERLLDGD